MDAEQALHAVQAALEAHNLPGSVGLRTSDRTFLVALKPADSKAADAVADLLEQMGMEVSVNGMVFGRLTGKLLPAPELPPAEVRSADSCRVVELVTVTEVPADKLCRGPCGQVKPLEEFSLNGRTPQGRQRRMHWCRPCHAAGQRAKHAASVTMS